MEKRGDFLKPVIDVRTPRGSMVLPTVSCPVSARLFSIIKNTAAIYIIYS
jgi:hypothetical protein